LFSSLSSQIFPPCKSTIFFHDEQSIPDEALLLSNLEKYQKILVWYFSGTYSIVFNIKTELVLIF
jgi:hypothetical protein